MPVAGHPCLFIHVLVIDGNKVTTVNGVFVDDLLVAGNSVDESTKVREQMNKWVLLTVQGEDEYCPRVSKIDQITLLLHQTGYAKKIIERFKMTECKPVKALLPRDLNLRRMDSPDEVNSELQSEYRNIWISDVSLSVDTS
jgi:hypothetical protein